jgi:catechol 2,3-dioxygenase-like lactoylglutathione lyase family enzyme
MRRRVPPIRKRAACGTWRSSSTTASKRALEGQGVDVEPVRVDEFTNKRFTFFADPDGLPLELYEA